MRYESYIIWSPWSEGLWQTKCGDHVVARWSKMNENLKIALERHLVDQFWWHIPLKIGIFYFFPNLLTSWSFKGHQRSLSKSWTAVSLVRIGIEGYVVQIFVMRFHLVRYMVRISVQNCWYGTRYLVRYKTIGTVRGILVQVFWYRYFRTGILVQVFWYFDTRILVQILVRMERGPRNEKNKYKTSFFERFFQIGIGPFIFPVFRNCSPNHVPYQKNPYRYGCCRTTIRTTYRTI